MPVPLKTARRAFSMRRTGSIHLPGRGRLCFDRFQRFPNRLDLRQFLFSPEHLAGFSSPKIVPKLGSHP